MNPGGYSVQFDGQRQSNLSEPRDSQKRRSAENPTVWLSLPITSVFVSSYRNRWPHCYWKSETRKERKGNFHQKELAKQTCEMDVPSPDPDSQTASESSLDKWRSMWVKWEESEGSPEACRGEKITQHTCGERKRQRLGRSVSHGSCFLHTLIACYPEEQTEAEGAREGWMPRHMSHKTILRCTEGRSMLQSEEEEEGKKKNRGSYDPTVTVICSFLLDLPQPQ